MTAPSNPQVVFVEDDDALREAMLQALRLEGISVEAFERAAPALKSLSPAFPGVVVSDIRLPGMDGLEFFDALRELDVDLPVIFTTGHGHVEMAVRAMKLGAADFLTKPYSTTALIDAIRRAAGIRALVLENRKLRADLRDREATGMIGSSERTQRLEKLLREVARTDIDIVLTGPAGTGKTFLARRLHDLGPRHGRPFISIDAGIWTHPDAELIVFGRDPSERLSRSGLVERAQGGTLLLDNIETVPASLEGRVASLMETRSFRPLGADRQRTADFRVVAIANKNETLVSSALLRRLGGVTIVLPSLAERRDDIPEILRHFVAEFEARTETATRPLRADEWSRLLAADWPGNVRELREFARKFVHGLTDYEADIVPPDATNRTLAALVMAFERSILVDALTRHGGRVSKVQSVLGVKRKTLYDKLARHGLQAGDFRNSSE